MPVDLKIASFTGSSTVSNTGEYEQKLIDRIYKFETFLYEDVDIKAKSEEGLVTIQEKDLVTRVKAYSKNNGPCLLWITNEQLKDLKLMKVDVRDPDKITGEEQG